MQKLRKALIFIFSLGMLLAYTPVYAESSNPTSSPEPSAEATESPEKAEEEDDSYSFGDVVKSLLKVFSREDGQTETEKQGASTAKPSAGAKNADDSSDNVIGNEIPENAIAVNVTGDGDVVVEQDGKKTTITGYTLFTGDEGDEIIIKASENDSGQKMTAMAVFMEDKTPFNANKDHDANVEYTAKIGTDRYVNVMFEKQQRVRKMAAFYTPSDAAIPSSGSGKLWATAPSVDSDPAYFTLQWISAPLDRFADTIKQYLGQCTNPGWLAWTDDNAYNVRSLDYTYSFVGDGDTKWLTITVAADTRRTGYHVGYGTVGYQGIEWTNIPITIMIPTKTIHVDVNKQSGNPVITENNSCYSLGGATYGIWKDEALTDKLSEVTTDANGKASIDISDVDNGVNTVWVQETQAPKGFLLDTTKYRVDLNNNRGSVTSTDAPKNDPINIVINKKSSEGEILKDNVAPLDNAQFTIKYYKDTYTSLDQLTGVVPIKTWVIATQKRPDGSYKARLSDNYIVPNSGSDVIDKDPNGVPVVYYGTLTIEETHAPEGYVTDGSTQYALWADGTKTDITEKVALFNVNEQFTTNGGATLYMANKGDVNSEQFQKTEKTARGGFSIAKRDVHFGSSTSGDSTNLIGTFSIFNNNNYAATLKYGDDDTDVVAIAQPKEYFHKVTRNSGNKEFTELTGDDNIYTFSTDANGNYTSFAHALQTGSYTLHEVSAPVGYDVKAAQDLPITIVQDAMPTFEIKNKPVYQGFEIQKKISSQNKPAPQDITIEFTVRNRSRFPIYISDFTDGNKWKEVKPGDLVYANPIRTNSKGYFKSPKEALPYGTYEIVETKAPAGVSLLGHPITMRVDENGQLIIDGKVANGYTITLNDSFVIEVLRAGGNGTSKYIGAGAIALAAASLVAIITKIKI